jgi:hypothetical protein
MEIERGRHWRPRFFDRSTQTSIVILRRAWSFTRLEGCTPLIPVAVSFEGRATIVRHVHETLRLARLRITDQARQLPENPDHV